MKKRIIIGVVLAMTVLGLVLTQTSALAVEKQKLNISLVCEESNDLYKTLCENFDGILRYDSFSEALENTGENGGIMVLAENYPTRTTLDVTAEQKQTMTDNGIRLYVEYPENNDVLGISYDTTTLMSNMRGVVTDADAMGMEEYSILYLHGARFVQNTDTTNSWLSVAKVAGYDTAVYGLTDCTPYAMIELQDNVMVACTKLSQFISARYAPYERWQQLWISVLSWVGQTEVASIEWEPLMQANYDKDEELSEDAYKEAVELNSEWYVNSGFVMSDEDAALYPTENNGATPQQRTLTLGGDGSNGIIEAYVSGKHFNEDGSQKMRFWRRADCNGESAGALALAGVVTGNEEYTEIAGNVMEWLLTESIMSQGDRANPESDEYGLLSWHDGGGSGSDDERYYGDDNAKAILGLISAAAALETDEYDERILEVILANFRTTGTEGFRGYCITGNSLNTNGWEYYYNTATTHYAPHYEALAWATYLWAYDKTGYEPLLERTKTGIENMMTAYENGEWVWTNGLQPERAKMILPLAWLVRIDDSEQNVEWLDLLIEDMMQYQDEETGAIRDVFGEAGQGKYGPFETNSEYGTHEAPIIQEDGDPCTDALYAANFAMLSLNEAYGSTGNAKYKAYSDSLSDFFVRIQQVSTDNRYNGAWFRAFDYEKWEVYGSDGDLGWGAWCIESGWTQPWISNTLSMKVLGTNIWDYTQGSTIGNYFVDTARVMLAYDPNQLIPEVTFTPEVTRKAEYGNNRIVDGVYGTTSLNDLYWIGLEGTDFTFVIDYKELKTFDSVTLGFLKSWASGIRVPETVEVLVSSDGSTYRSLGTFGTTLDYVDESNSIERLSLEFDETTARYVKVVVTNPGVLPEGHKNAGKVCWVFMDEFEIHITKATLADLYELLESARAVDIGSCTPSTGLALSNALYAAEQVYGQSKPSATDVDKVYDDLLTAYENIESGAWEVVSNTMINLSSYCGTKEELLDGIYSTAETHADGVYVGWKNSFPVEVVVDLKEVTDINTVGYSCLSHPRNGIYIPNTTIYVSDSLDGTWTQVGYIAAQAHDDEYTTRLAIRNEIELDDVTGRYVKYIFEQDNDHLFTVSGRTYTHQFVFIDELIINNPDTARTLLQELVDSLKDKDLHAYTENAVSVFENAYAAAESVLQNDDAAEFVLRGAYEDLMSAYRALRNERIRNVLSVKCQATAGTTADSTSANLRLVSSIDGLDYLEVGFEVYFKNRTEPVYSRTTTVYERIRSNEISNVEYEYGPKVVDVASEYFITATIINISQDRFDETIHVRPYCITMDGETIYGIDRYVKVSDSYSNLVNIPVAVESLEEAKALTVQYGNSVLTPTEYRYTSNGDYATLMVAVDDVKAMPSATAFDVLNGETEVPSYVHRNYETQYNGSTGDQTWYTAYDSGERAFVIATIADLYGFAELVNGGEDFADNTVYLCADIMADETDNNWTPIGNGNYPFKGIFNGFGHTVGGFSVITNAHRVGLFGMTADGSTLQNFQVVDSCFKSTGNAEQLALLGSVAGELRGNLYHVFSNATVETDGIQVGGLVGRANSVLVGGTRISVNIDDCWFDGKVLMTGAASVQGGGIIGVAQQGNVNLSNCLFTGYISCEATDTGLHVGGIMGNDVVSVGTNVSISDSLSTGEVDVNYTSCVASVVGRIKSEYSTYTFDNVYATNECYTDASGNAITIKNTAGITLSEEPTALSKASFYGTKGTALLPEETWMPVAGDTPILSYFADWWNEENNLINVYTDMQAYTYTDGETTMPYRLYVPEDYNPEEEYPMVVFLHGSGQRGDNNEGQLFLGIQTLFNEQEAFREAIVIAPQCPTGKRWVETDWTQGCYSVDSVGEEQLATVMDILEDVQSKYTTDIARVYAIGLSMGGFGTWDLLMRHSDVFAAAIPVCGAGDPNYANILKDVPIWTFHGSVDSIVPYSATESMVMAIQNAGGEKIKFTTYEGVDHTSWDLAFSEDGLIEWLFEQELAE